MFAIANTSFDRRSYIILRSNTSFAVRHPSFNNLSAKPINYCLYADMVELAASNPTAAGGGNREDEMAQRSKSAAKNEARDDFGHRKSNGYLLKILICGYGGIGRHARFRILCSDACRFNPCYPHQTRKIRTKFSQ